MGGAGWEREEAELAGVGEAIERWQTHRMPQDQTVTASFRQLEERAVDPRTWVLFHRDQYASDEFPFEAIDADTECEWVRFREAGSGEPWWVPAELAFLDLRPGTGPRFGPTISTGWSAHSAPQTAMERGLQEVVERDAMIGAWWGRYDVVEHAHDDILAGLPGWVRPRVERPNLRYRWYHIDTPISRHTTAVTVSGDDHEGFCFSIGSACRDTREASWMKSLLEAIQGRHYVRYLIANGLKPDGAPRKFGEHAVVYSVSPELLSTTCLEAPPLRAHEPGPTQPIDELMAGLDAPVLFRAMTPPALTGWSVLRVMVPGLQPLHGDHHLPFLGGPLWGDRPIAAWADVPPHPFA